MEFTIILLFSLSTQWIPMVNGELPGASLELDRQERDTIFDNKCLTTFRATGSSVECTCKSQYATVMSKEDKGWNCNTPKEIGCQYYLGETDKTYLINKTKETVEFVPSITGNDTSIQNIFIWNYRLDLLSDEGHWEDVTAAVLHFFALDHGGKNKLLTSDLDLNAWRGHALKIVLGGGKCVVAKMRGRINYPIDLDEFKRNVTTPVITTTTPSSETTASVKPTTSRTTTPITKPTTATQRKKTTIIKTTPPTTTAQRESTTITKTTPPTATTQRKNATIIKTTTASVITRSKPTARTPGKLHSKSPTTYVVIGVLLVVLVVATVFVFMIRRRRLSTTHKKFENNDEKKV